MQVEAEVWYWSATGMMRQCTQARYTETSYITKQEAERLLDEAHERGRQEGRSERNGE